METEKKNQENPGQLVLPDGTVLGPGRYDIYDYSTETTHTFVVPEPAPDLVDIYTGEVIRKATDEEWAASLVAAIYDNGVGAIDVEIDGSMTPCFVQD